MPRSSIRGGVVVVVVVLVGEVSAVVEEGDGVGVR